MRKLLISEAILMALFLGLAIHRSLKTGHSAFELAPTGSNTSYRVTNSSPPSRATSTFDSSLPSLAETEVDSNATNIASENFTDAELSAELDKLSTKVDPDSTEMQKLLIRRWAESDAPAAAAGATQYPESSIRNDMLEQVAIAWVNTNSADAVAWLLALPEGESKQVAILAAAYEAAQASPITALDLASELPAGNDRDALLEHAVSQWANQDFATASQWVELIADAELRQRLLAAAAIAASSEGASGAARLIASAIPPGETQARAAVSITQRWAQSSPSDAAAWISQFPEMPARDAAVENLVALWAQADTQATANWLNSLPDGSLRLAAINAFTNSMAQ